MRFGASLFIFATRDSLARQPFRTVHGHHFFPALSTAVILRRLKGAERSQLDPNHPMRPSSYSRIRAAIE